ncbi:MAG: hypothetical protein R6U91_06070 [Bacillota bacterium]
MNKIMSIKQGIKKQSRRLPLYLLALSLLLCAWQVRGIIANEEIIKLHKELAGLEAEKTSLTELITTAPKKADDLAELDNKRQNTGFRVAESDDVPFVLASLEEMFNGYPLQVETFSAGEMTTENDHFAVGVDLQFSGSKGHLQNLLMELEDFPYLITFKRVTWEQTAENTANLKLKLQLIVSCQESWARP